MAPEVQCRNIGVLFNVSLLLSRAGCHLNTQFNSFSEVNSPSLSSSGFLPAQRGPHTGGYKTQKAQTESLCYPLAFQLPHSSVQSSRKSLCPTPVLTVEPWNRAAIKAAFPGLCSVLKQDWNSGLLLPFRDTGDFIQQRFQRQRARPPAAPASTTPIFLGWKCCQDQ